MYRFVLVASIFALSLPACSMYKTTVTHRLTHPSFPAPVVQGVLDKAASQAAESSLASLDKRLKGKTVCVEVEGVLPMSDKHLLARTRGLTEAGLAARGAIVKPCCTLVEIETDGLHQDRVYRCKSDLDYRAVVGVGVGGIDESRERIFNAKKGIGPGLLLLSALGSTVFALSAVPPERDYQIARVAGGGAVAFTLLAGAVIWAIIEPPYDYAIDLDARVEMDVALLPQHPSGKPFRATGSGTQRLRITDEYDSPYLVVE